MRFAPDCPMRLAPATAADYRELARRRLRASSSTTSTAARTTRPRCAPTSPTSSDVLLRQVVMRDVSARDPAVEVLGQPGDAGGLAPIGLAGMFARRAEVQAARAAEAMGVPFVESTVSICSIEEVAKATRTPPWFQLYVMRDRGYAEDLMARARAVGSPVLVLTDRPRCRGAAPRHARRGGRRSGHVGQAPPGARPRVPSALDRRHGARRAAR